MINIDKKTVLSTILLFLGFTIFILILVHYNTETSIRPEPNQKGIFNVIGIQIRYPVLVGVVSFITVIKLNRLNSLLFRILGAVGLIFLLLPFILYYLFSLIVFLYNLPELFPL